MISDFDGGYVCPEITEREALCELHRLYPTATIEPVPGNPNLMGSHLFKVFNQPTGLPTYFLVDKDGTITELDNNVPLVGAE